MENRRLWIIGDSFASPSPNAWVLKICNQFNGNGYEISSKGSRDTQSILDVFLRKLHLMTPNDLVILFLPTAERVRLPLLNPTIDTMNPNQYKVILDYFIGSHSYVKDDMDKQLEPPLLGLDDKLLHSSQYELNTNLMHIVNASKANINNFSEILKSLKLFLNFTILVYSWVDEYPSDIVIGKSEITSILEFWETRQLEFINTNGVDGDPTDGHWSFKMHDAFANYLIYKHPEFFNV
jgi:hypothetical protein